MIAVLFKQARGVLAEELVVLVDIADTLFREQLQAALHLAHRIAQGIRCQAGLGDDRHVQMRNAFIDA